jgi:hypothetical protein
MIPMIVPENPTITLVDAVMPLTKVNTYWSFTLILRKTLAHITATKTAMEST